jgi:hypothetical protein
VSGKQNQDPPHLFDVESMKLVRFRLTDRTKLVVKVVSGVWFLSPAFCSEAVRFVFTGISNPSAVSNPDLRANSTFDDWDDGDDWGDWDDGGDDDDNFVSTRHHSVIIAQTFEIWEAIRPGCPLKERPSGAPFI